MSHLYRVRASTVRAIALILVWTLWPAAAHGGHHHHHDHGHNHDHHHHHHGHGHAHNVSHHGQATNTDATPFRILLRVIFPGSPMVNSLLGTAYVSLIPNMFLQFVPANIQPGTMKTLVAFAVGGLLGDVFLHLLPHAFQSFAGSDSHTRDVVLGMSVFGGFFGFFCIDKLTRVWQSPGDHHHHLHQHDHETTSSNNTILLHQDFATTTPSKRKLARKGSRKQKQTEPLGKDKPTNNIKGSAYLNLLADASHNFTDGLAMAASFYASPAIGATTTVAVFFHEIPHEIGDYAILIQSGFTKSMAMKAQFVTAVGAFLGTIVGIVLEEWGRQGSRGDTFARELVLPITAGGFLYIGSVGVIPDLLSLSGKRSADLAQFSRETIAMLTGVGLMAAIALNE
ncbi:hypothetical protein CPB97_010060 [Podila verticillata]|nr:hypothetical protein CPB97_010060 [Podila verticillata]